MRCTSWRRGRNYRLPSNETLSWRSVKVCVVRPEGFEPPTVGLKVRNSGQTELQAHGKLEPMAGIEPAFSAWKAGTLAIELHRQRWLFLTARSNIST